ncbi:hypothetical protein [Profundibacter sp.]
MYWSPSLPPYRAPISNPAITTARSLSDTFAGIYPAHMPMFIVLLLIGIVAVSLILPHLFKDQS